MNSKKNKEKEVMSPDHDKWSKFCLEVLRRKICHSDGRELENILKKFNASGEWLNEHGAFCVCEVQFNIIDLLYLNDRLPPEVSKIYAASIKDSIEADIEDSLPLEC